MTHFNLFPNHSPCEEGERKPPRHEKNFTANIQNSQSSGSDGRTSLTSANYTKNHIFIRNIKVGQSSYERKIMEGMIQMDREA